MESTMRSNIRKVYHTDYSVILLSQCEHSLIESMYKTLCRKEVGTAISVCFDGVNHLVYLAPIPDDTHPWSSICYITEKESGSLNSLSKRAHFLDIIDFDSNKDLHTLISGSLNSPKFQPINNWDEFMDAISMSDTFRFSHALSIINDDFRHRKSKLPMDDTDIKSSSHVNEREIAFGEIYSLNRPTYQDLIDYYFE